MRLMKGSSIAGLIADLDTIMTNMNANNATITNIMDGTGTVPGSITEMLSLANTYTDSSVTNFDPSQVGLNTDAITLLNADSTVVGSVANSGATALSDAVKYGMVTERISAMMVPQAAVNQSLAILNCQVGEGADITNYGAYKLDNGYLTGAKVITSIMFADMLAAGTVELDGSVARTYTNGALLIDAATIPDATYSINVAGPAGSFTRVAGEVVGEVYTVVGLDTGDATNQTLMIEHLGYSGPALASTPPGTNTAWIIDNADGVFDGADWPSMEPIGSEFNFVFTSSVNVAMGNPMAVSTSDHQVMVNAPFTASDGDIVTFTTMLTDPLHIMASVTAVTSANVSQPCPAGSVIKKFQALVGGADALMDTVKELGDAVLDDIAEHTILNDIREANKLAVTGALSDQITAYDDNNIVVDAKFVTERGITDTAITDGIAAYDVIAMAKFYKIADNFGETPGSGKFTARDNLGLITADDFLTLYIAAKDIYHKGSYSVVANEIQLNAITTKADIKWIRKYYPGNEYDDILLETGSAPGKFKVYLNIHGDLDGTNVKVRYVERKS